MISRKGILILFLAVVIGSGLVIYGTTDKIWKREPPETRVELNLNNETPSKEILATTEGSFGQNHPLRVPKVRKDGERGFSDPESRVESFRRRQRRHSRRKRNVPDQDPNEWFFNLKVARPDSLSDARNPRFGITIHVEGKVGPKEGPDGIQEAWDSLETLVVRLFGDNYEELSKKGHEVVIDLSGLPEGVQTDLKAKEQVLREVEQPKGKSLFGIIRGILGGNRDKPSTAKGIEPSSVDQPIEIVPLVSGPVTTGTPLLEVRPSDTTISFLAIPTSVEPLETLVGENVGATTLRSSESSSDLPVFPLVENTPVVSDEVSSAPSSSAIIDEDEVLDKLRSTSTIGSSKHDPTESLVLHNSGVTMNLDKDWIDLGLTEKSETPTTTESFFPGGLSVSAEQLREFCVNILEKLEKSPRLVQEQNEEGNVTANDDSRTLINDTTEMDTTTEATEPPKPQNSGFFASILNLVVGRSATKKAEKDVSKSPKSDNRQAGKGRSLKSELENFQLEDIDLNGTQFEDLDVTISDCEMFFKDWVSTERDPMENHSPNLENVSIPFDATLETNIIDTPDIHGNSSLVGNARSSVVEYVIEDNVETFSETSTAKIKDEALSDLSDIHGNSSLVRNPKSSFVEYAIEDNVETFSETSTAKIKDEALSDPSDIHGNSSLFRNSKSSFVEYVIEDNVETFSETSTAKIKDEALSFEMRSEVTITAVTSEESEEKDARVFGIFALGSGGREIPVDMDEELAESLSTSPERGPIERDSSDIEAFSEENIMKATTEKDGGRIIGFMNFGSGERQLGEDSQFATDGSFTGISEFGTAPYLEARDPYEVSNFSYYATGTVSRRFDEMSSTTLAVDSTDEDDPNDGRFAGFFGFGSGDVGRELPDGSMDIYLPDCVTCAVDNATGEVKCSECTPEEAAARKSETTDESGRFFFPDTRDSTEEIVMNEDDDNSTTTTVLPIKASRGSRALEWNSEERFDHDESVSTRVSMPTPAGGRRGRAEDPFVAEIVTTHYFEPGVDSISVEISRKAPKPVFNESWVEYVVPASNGTAPSTSAEAPSSTSVGTVEESTGCSGDDDCSVDSNEKCLVKEGQSVCECEEGFVRFPNTKICSKRLIIEVAMKFPKETYHPNLNDSSSESYKAKRRDFIETVKVFLEGSPLLRDALVDIRIKRFEPGSLVVHADLEFAVPEGANSVDMIKGVSELLMESFQEPNYVVPLNLEKAKVMKLFVEGDACELKGKSDCHESAKCIQLERGNYTCRCEKGYADLNFDGRPGRMCEACPVELCGKNGICRVAPDGTKFCQCTGWSVGSNCEIAGEVVVVGVAAVNGLFLLTLVGIICFCKRRKSHSIGGYGGEEGGLGGSGRSSRLREAVVMNELGQGVVASRYTSKSTPRRIKCPDINIISPSVLGSDQSSVFDSTFDRSPCEPEDVEAKSG